MNKSLETVLLSLTILFVAVFLIHPIVKQNGSLLMAFLVGGCIGYISHHIASFLINNK